MEIKQLQYFVVSVDTGSFYSAAKALLTTQPNVSKVVKSLEQELNKTLLKRSKNGVTITKEGEHIYSYAIDILKNVRSIKNCKQCKGIERLSIGSVTSNTLTKYMSHFYEDTGHRNVKIEFCQSSVEDMIINTHTKRVEIGFVYISNKNKYAFKKHIKSKSIEYHELCKTSLYLFVGKRSPLYNHTSVNEGIIRNVKLMQYYEEKYSLYNHLGHIKEELFYGGDEVDISYTNSESFLIQLLKNTDYGFIGSSFGDAKYDNYDIKAIPIESSEKSVSFGYIKHSRCELSKITEDFISYIKKKL